MFSKLLCASLLVLCVQAAPQEHGYGHATSYATFTQHHQEQQQHIQTIVKATLPVAVHTQLSGHSYHAAPVVHAVPIVHAAPVKHVEHYAHPKYEFKYGVEDHHTGDIKSQQESRDGDVVKGQYSLHEPDGTILTVKYVADKHSGFNAVVHRQGHANHPQHVAKAVVAVPVHHY